MVRACATTSPERSDDADHRQARRRPSRSADDPHATRGAHGNHAAESLDTQNEQGACDSLLNVGGHLQRARLSAGRPSSLPSGACRVGRPSRCRRGLTRHGRARPERIGVTARSGNHLRLERVFLDLTIDSRHVVDLRPRARGYHALDLVVLEVDSRVVVARVARLHLA